MDTWSILVAGYGEFLFDGTEAEAEEMRAHKARWERGVAIKRKATAEEIKAGKPSGCWNHAGFGKKVKYSCGCGDCQ